MIYLLSQNRIVSEGVIKINLDEIYRRNIDTVYSICFLELKNSKDTEDVAQEVFINYMSKELTFENLNHERAFFITATRNLSRDQYKRFWKKWRDYRSIEDTQLNIDAYFTYLNC